MAFREDIKTAERPVQEVAGSSYGADTMVLQECRNDPTSTSSANELDTSLSSPNHPKEGTSLDGHTRRLLERVGHLQSALSCLLTPEDADSVNEREKPVLDHGFGGNCAGFSISDILIQSAIVEAPEKLGASVKGSFDLTCRRPQSVEDGGAKLKLMRASQTATSTRKRKPTRISVGDDCKDARRRSGDEVLRQHESLSPSVCSLLLESLPKVTGVFFDRSQERWVSSVYMGGRNIKSYFPVYKHGFLQARNMAISQRLSQVAHKGVSRTEVDALTPPSLTVEALLETLKSRGTSNSTISLLPGSSSSSAKAELQQEAGAKHFEDEHATRPCETCLLPEAKLCAKIASESPRASICSKSTTSPVSHTTTSPRVGAASAENGSNVSLSSPFTVGLSCGLPLVTGDDASSCTSLLSSLHMYAALDFCPWERGVAWGAEACAWAVQQASSSEGVVHVPVRLAEKHKETLEAVGQWVARQGDSSKCSKLALELRRVGRLRACKVQQEEVLEEQGACRLEVPFIKNDDAKGPALDGKKRQHTEEDRRLAFVLQQLSGSRAGGQCGGSSGVEEGKQRGGETNFMAGIGEIMGTPEIEAAAGAVFQAVGQAYAEALVILRRSEEPGSDDELLSTLEDRASAGGAPQGVGNYAEEGGSDEDSVLSPVGRINKEEELCATPFRDATHASNNKSSGIAKRALMTRAAIALKPWPQGVSWASSSGRWFAVARLPSGSRVARTFHPSTKGGVEEAYRLACDFLKRIKDDPEAVQADLMSSNKCSLSSSRRSLTLGTKHEQELFVALPDVQPSRSSTGLCSGSTPNQNVAHRWQRQVRPVHHIPRADRLLPVDLEGLAAMEACCRGDYCTPEAVSCGSSPSSKCLLLDVCSFRNSQGNRELAPLSAEQQRQLQKLADGGEELWMRDNMIENRVRLLQSGKYCTSGSVGLNQGVPHNCEGRVQVDEGEAQILSLQQEAVRRCLLDLRELSASLFAPHVGEQKAATVDAHLALVSKAQSFQHVVVYLHLFESALFGGQLPSRMSVETQRVFFGALDALSGALKLQKDEYS